MSNQQIVDAGKRWADAERRADSDALDALLADDFVGIGPLGFVLNREQWLGRYRSGGLKNKKFDWQDVSVREYGDVAVAVGVQSQQSTWQGRESSGRFRVSQMYVRKGNRWLIAHIQLSGPMQDVPLT